MTTKIDFYQFDSTSRCEAVISHYSTVEINRVNTRLFWRDLSKFWMTFDSIDHDGIADLMFNIPWRSSYLTKECQRDLDLLSDDDVITLYRGQNDHRAGSDYVTGLSWTTDVLVAEKFARNGIRGHTTGTPYILKAELPKREIAMAFNDRGEAELVLFELDVAGIETIYLD